MTHTTGTATELSGPLTDFVGDARLYGVTPPMRHETYDHIAGETVETFHKYVIVSTADVPFSGQETYIFPADAEGNVVVFHEMKGSMKGDHSHVEVLNYVGYVLV